ncbi:MAG: pilus assembly protein N-terminal domain-containing protein [Rhizobiales bacterium]|nr:pilus assembly protein N-terminal domain-containing protein [Hyphomicrobiales bacterium]
MAAFSACNGPRLGVLLASALAAVVSTAVLSPETARAADAMTVHVDQAAILKLPERTATLVIGNPLIADATVQPGGIAVVTAKSYGATNLIALDGAGATLMQQTIQVEAPTDRIVVVYRGANRESYSCMPQCQHRITLGDTPDYFAANLGQVGAVGSQAGGQK